LLTMGKLSVNLLEKIYGPSSEYQNDDGDNGGGGIPACVPQKGTLFICPGGFGYFQSRIGVTPITNLDIAYRMTDHLRLSMGAINLFNRFPGRLNAQQLSHTNNPFFGDNAGVTQYPVFSPFGINGGFYYVKGTFTF
jgi:hypothetical protein